MDTTKILKLYDDQLLKEAQFSILSSIFDSIMSDVKNTIATTSENPVTSVLQFFAEAYISYKFGFIWGIATAILDKAFGINIRNVLEVAKSVMSNFLSTKSPESIRPDADGKTITTSILNRVGLTQDEQNETFDQLESKASLNLSIIKQADVKTFWGQKLSIYSILSTIIIAILKGFAISVAGGTIVKQIQKTTPPTTTQPSQIGLNITTGTSSSFGDKQYTNDADQEGYGNKAWYIVLNGNFSNTIMDWVEKVYPNMPDDSYRNITTNLNKHIPTLYKTFKEWNIPTEFKDGARIRVPNQYKNIKQIVDTFLALFQKGS
jgi:hypothetical protein